MADLQRLLNIRCVQEKVAEEAWMEARARLVQTEHWDRSVQHEQATANARRVERQRAGDREGVLLIEQQDEQLTLVAGKLGRRLEQERERVAALAAIHAASYRERRRLDILAAAGRKEHLRREQSMEQRTLDDAYLAFSRRKHR